MFAVSTKEFLGEKGKVTGIRTVHVEMKEGKFVEVPGSEQTLPADLVLFAMGFVSPVQTVLQAFGVKTDGRANASAPNQDTHRGVWVLTTNRRLLHVDTIPVNTH